MVDKQEIVEGEADGAAEERILAAAHAVFLKRGTYGARMQEIADEAGVNKALLHYYFRSKERLAEAVFQHAIGQIMPRVFGIVGSDLALEAKVHAVVEAELEFFSAHPYLPGYVLAEANFNPERIQKMFARGGAPPLGKLQEQLDEAAATSTMRPMRAQQFLVNLVSLLVFPFAARPLLDVLLGTGGDGFRDFIEERRGYLAEFVLRGMRP
ncbi:MAG: regulatory protein TetR [Gemmatimonadetes bacterium]|nr:regulatory protein TetR [Gemmatimonadota bacterium]